MTAITVTRDLDIVHNIDDSQDDKTMEGSGNVSETPNHDQVPPSVAFFGEQNDLVAEIFSFLDPPSLLKLCRAMPPLSSILTHKHVVRSIADTLNSDVYNHNNECYRRNRHKHRHIQYHRIVVSKLVPNFQKNASTRQTPMQLLRSVSGRYCARCQLDLICVTGW